jgi:hypothetical protein
MLGCGVIKRLLLAAAILISTVLPGWTQNAAHVPSTPASVSTPRQGSGFNLPLVVGESYSVRDAPFSVEVKAVWAGTAQMPSGSAVSRAMRDKDGRQRVEAPVDQEAYSSGQSPQVTIYDLVADRMIKLDQQNKTATVSPLAHVNVPVPLPIEIEAQKAGLGDPIGKRLILGMEAEGWRKLQTWRYPDGTTKLMVQDVWFSIAGNSHLPLMAEYDNPIFGKVVQRVVRLESSEPDPALFAVPAGYKIVEVKTIP